MIWVSIILGILQALPEIIKLIQEIFGKVDNAPIGTRLKLQHELQGHLLAWHHGGGDDQLKAALHSMGHGLGCPSAVAPGTAIP